MAAPVYSDEAETDIRRVARQSLRLFGPLQARRYVHEIRRAIEKLADGQRIGRPYENSGRRYVVTLVGAHLVFARFDIDGRLCVIRILHSRMKREDHL